MMGRHGRFRAHDLQSSGRREKGQRDSCQLSQHRIQLGRSVKKPSRERMVRGGLSVIFE